MRFIVDRIENEFAVCENENKDIVNIPITELPSNITEKSIIDYIDSQYIINDEEKIKREETIKEKMNSVWDD
ncbi:MAG: DUF3006 domain-containing protein [Bacilli bacterium]